jgi:CDP-diacylglycerol--glycerol-3-phosphate 3-phosphatidyltransferase
LLLSPDPQKIRISFLIFTLASLTDWYDGWHARKYGQISRVGIFIDPLADKFLTSMAFIGFYILNIMPLWMVLIIVIRDMVITLLRSIKESKGITIKTSYSAKVKTFIQMFYIYLIVFIMVLLTFKEFSLNDFLKSFLYSDFNYFLMLLLTMLTLFSGIQYFFGKEVLVFKKPLFKSTNEIN